MTVRPGAPPGPVRDDVVATVGSQVISVDLVDLRLAEMRRGPRARHIPPDGVGGSETMRRWVVQELVTEAIVAHEARAAGIADVAEARQLSPADLVRLVTGVTADASVPEAEVRAYFDRNPDLYPDSGFDDVRAAIEEELLVAARIRAFDEWLERRRAALVSIEPGFEHPGHPIHGVPSHRH